MAGQVTKSNVLSIYKKLLRESQKFEAYNYREYALRRIKDAFRENKSLQKQSQVKSQYEFALKNLNIIQKQVVVGQLYATEKLVIENIQLPPANV